VTAVFIRHAVPDSSSLHILSCFGIIESLLTHNPGDREVGDSLTHQLETKLAFLEKMFCRPLDFSIFGKQFATADGKAKAKIWKALYGYRSSIAHGDRFMFAEKFKTLGSPEAALSFLREVTKLVLIVGLEKPNFLEDLKAV
jgi:hypothetical protein